MRPRQDAAIHVFHVVKSCIFQDVIGVGGAQARATVRDDLLGTIEFVGS